MPSYKSLYGFETINYNPQLGSEKLCLSSPDNMVSKIGYILSSQQLWNPKRLAFYSVKADFCKILLFFCAFSSSMDQSNA